MNHGFKHTFSIKDSLTNYCVLLMTVIIVSHYNVNKISKCFFIKHTIYSQKSFHKCSNIIMSYCSYKDGKVEILILKLNFKIEFNCIHTIMNINSLSSVYCV